MQAQIVNPLEEVSNVKNLSVVVVKMGLESGDCLRNIVRYLFKAGHCSFSYLVIIFTRRLGCRSFKVQITPLKE